MAVQKHYAGTQLRELRGRLGLTQKLFAERLGVSLPYLNQMENNNRPVSTNVVLALASEFRLDVTELSSGDGERLVSDLREALADPNGTTAANVTNATVPDLAKQIENWQTVLRTYRAATVTDQAESIAAQLQDWLAEYRTNVFNFIDP